MDIDTRIEVLQTLSDLANSPTMSVRDIEDMFSEGE